MADRKSLLLLCELPSGGTARKPASVGRSYSRRVPNCVQPGTVPKRAYPLQSISAYLGQGPIYAAKYPKATQTLKKDRESLLAFYEFPAEHWQHLRTTNAIESTFATVRHRTTRTRNCVSRPTFLGLAFKLIEEAEKTWRRINGPEQIKLLLEGIAFRDGEPVQDDQPGQQKLAA
jgi:putative transposase